MPLLMKKCVVLAFLYVLKEFTVKCLLQVAYEKYIERALLFWSKHANHVWDLQSVQVHGLLLVKWPDYLENAFQRLDMER